MLGWGKFKTLLGPAPTCVEKLGQLVGRVDLEVLRAAPSPLPQPLVQAEHQLARQEDAQLQVGKGHLRRKQMNEPVSTDLWLLILKQHR